jgi:hypothetical protein
MSEGKNNEESFHPVQAQNLKTETSMKVEIEAMT